MLLKYDFRLLKELFLELNLLRLNFESSQINLLCRF